MDEPTPREAFLGALLDSLLTARPRDEVSIRPRPEHGGLVVTLTSAEGTQLRRDVDVVSYALAAFPRAQGEAVAADMAARMTAPAPSSAG